MGDGPIEGPYMEAYNWLLQRNSDPHSAPERHSQMIELQRERKILRESFNF